MNNYKKERSNQLGMPYGTATTKLRLKVIFDLLKESDRNYCSSCSKSINSPEDLSVAHRNQWFDVDPNLFWKTDNIVFKHQNCEEINKMKIVDFSVVNENGDKLNTYSHDGKIWVAGNKNERYNILLKNNSSSRIEVVCSVDGRDVISGESGDYKTQRGYIINPFDSYRIEGFRQSNEKVAAFRFSNSDKSYSSKMGTPQNVGIIGVAVFKEKFVPFLWGQTFQGGNWPYNNHNHHGSGDFWWHRYGHYGVDITCDSSISNVLRSAVPRGGGGGGTFTAASVSSVAPVNEIGTEYGESVFSSVSSTYFNREVDSSPNEISLMRYDSINGLKKRGIDITKPLGPREPQAFPGVEVAPGFAQPPPK